VAANGGVVMANFVPQFIDAARVAHSAERAGQTARTNTLYLGQPERAASAMAEWDKANPVPVVTLSVVADHLDHIAKVAGHDHAGIGADYDGIASLPLGLEGVESYPALFAELLRRGWTDDQLTRLAGGNILRALAQAETIAASLKNNTPSAMTP